LQRNPTRTLPTTRDTHGRKKRCQLPLRTMVLFSKGMMSFPALDILIVALNGNIGLALYQVVYICLKALVGWTVSKLSL
jgi:hypothetical protein